VIPRKKEEIGGKERRKERLKQMVCHMKEMQDEMRKLEEVMMELILENGDE
jgi:hypothetical protein